MTRNVEAMKREALKRITGAASRRFNVATLQRFNSLLPP